jgi:transketolase
LYGTGIMTALALGTAEILAGEGLEAAVLNVATIKPLAAAEILAAAAGKGLAVTMEEHWISGGLGSAVAEVLAEAGEAPPLLRIGVADQFGQSATADELLAHYGLTPPQMAETILARYRALSA